LRAAPGASLDILQCIKVTTEFIVPIERLLFAIDEDDPFIAQLACDMLALGALSGCFFI
jgi:hypothetical protein